MIYASLHYDLDLQDQSYKEPKTRNIKTLHFSKSSMKIIVHTIS